MIRKEPKHARKAREGSTKHLPVLDPWRKKRRKRRAKRKPRTAPPKTWEAMEIERLNHDRRLAEDAKLEHFFADVFNAQLSNRAVLFACEITERGQLATLSIPIVQLRETCRILKQRIDQTPGGAAP